MTGSFIKDSIIARCTIPGIKEEKSAVYFLYCELKSFEKRATFIPDHNAGQRHLTYRQTNQRRKRKTSAYYKHWAAVVHLLLLLSLSLSLSSARSNWLNSPSLFHPKVRVCPFDSSVFSCSMNLPSRDLEVLNRCGDGRRSASWISPYVRHWNLFRIVFIVNDESWKFCFDSYEQRYLYKECEARCLL